MQRAPGSNSKIRSYGGLGWKVEDGIRVTNEIRSSRFEFRSGVLEDVAKGKPKSARFGLSGVVGRVAGNFIWEAI